MTTANLIEIFCILDEFCKYFTPELKKHLVDTSGKRRRNRPCRLFSATNCELLTLNYYDIQLTTSSYRRF